MLGELSKHMDTLILGFFLIAAICFIIWVNRK
jgi:hypothetical protein